MYILFLTKWYPNKEDPQNGLFVKNHALAVAKNCKVNLIHIESAKNLTQGIHITHTAHENLNEFIAQFRKSNYSLINFIRYFFAFLKTYKLIVKKFGDKPALIHANMLLRSAAIAYALHVIYNIPFIITEHWTGYVSGLYNKKNKLYKFLTRHIVSKAYCITTVSEHLKNDMIKCDLKGNYKIIPNAIDNPPAEIAYSPNTAATKTIIVTAADLIDIKKNISSTIKVISELVMAGKEIEYHIIGTGKDELCLKNLADDLGVRNKTVFFHGLQNNEYVYRQLLTCSFVVINSTIETFSVFAAEALICGKPVIATICGGPEEFITEEVGILIEKNNPQQLKEAILNMIENYSKFSSTKLIAYANSKFNIQTVGKQFFDIYTEALSARLIITNR